jgi:hypothetical protein
MTSTSPILSSSFGRPCLKHRPFVSRYREDFQVVEERRRNTTLYPHTEQLPLLWRALNLEFTHPLPDRIARTDHRGDMLRKMMLDDAVHIFCTHVNRDRADAVRLFHYRTPELVSKISIIQHIKESDPRGAVHRFRFYVGNDFVPDIHLNGKRIAFAGHVLERFTRRVPHRVGEDLRDLVLAFFGSCMFSMPINTGRAFVIPFFNSLLAFTYKETAEEYFITTCLTVRELHGLVLEDPVQVAYLHHGAAFTPPTDTRNWMPQPIAEYLHQVWKDQVILERGDAPPASEDTWYGYATRIRRVTELEHGLDSSMEFAHHVYGPGTVHIPGPSGTRSTRSLESRQAGQTGCTVIQKANAEELQDLARAIAGETAAGGRWQKN